MRLLRLVLADALELLAIEVRSGGAEAALTIDGEFRVAESEGEEFPAPGLRAGPGGATRIETEAESVGSLAAGAIRRTGSPAACYRSGSDFHVMSRILANGLELI